MVRSATKMCSKDQRSIERSARRLTVFAAISAIALIGGDVSALAQQTAKPSPVNLFQDQASKLGARQCAGLYAALGQGMTQGAAFALKTEADKKSPDKHMVQGVVGMTYNLPDLKGPAGGIVLAGPSTQGCEGYLVRIAPFQKPCAEVVRSMPVGTVGEQTLSGVPQYRLGGNQGQALMISSGGGCVVVTLFGATQRA